MLIGTSSPPAMAGGHKGLPYLVRASTNRWAEIHAATSITTPSISARLALDGAPQPWPRPSASITPPSPTPTDEVNRSPNKAEDDTKPSCPRCAWANAIDVAVGYVRPIPRPAVIHADAATAIQMSSKMTMVPRITSTPTSMVETP